MHIRRRFGPEKKIISIMPSLEENHCSFGSNFSDNISPPSNLIYFEKAIRDQYGLSSKNMSKVLPQQ
jgi:hypothetical protein